MSFAFPLGLAGLLSLPVILALHLIRERQRRYVVSDLGLWSFLDQERRGPLPRRLPLTWLLLLDLAAAALFSLAWARPRLDVRLPVLQSRHQIILIDVSTSMRARLGLSDRLAQAKTEASGLLRKAGRRDIVTIVIFGRTARLLGDSRQVDLDTLTTQLETLRAGETGYALQEAAAIGLAGVDGRRPVELHILTDGAFPEAATSGLAELASPPRWHFIGGPQDNVAILALNATPLGEDRYQVFARVANFSGQWVRRRAVLQAGGQTLARANLEIPAESVVSHIWEVAGRYEAFTVFLQDEVGLPSEDGLPADDAAFFATQPTGGVRVILVAEQAQPLQQAIESVPQVDLEVILPQDYDPGQIQPAPDLTVFRGFLPPAWPGGPILVVEPPAVGSAAADHPLAVEGRASSLPPDAPLQFPAPDLILAGIDFNGVRWGRAWRLVGIPEGFTTLLQAGEVPLVLRGTVNGAPLWVLLADLGRGNFTKHPAFPILLANYALAGRAALLPPSLPAGAALPIPAAGTVQVVAPGQVPIEIPAGPGASWTGTQEPGLYQVIVSGDRGQAAQIYLTGINAGDAEESDLRPRTWTRVDLVGQDPAASAGTTGERREETRPPVELAPWLLGAALFVLLLEASLAWR